jgi:lipopolysaccharide/colanic/teichoic acid biosynthesis glycosyltransferase
MYKIYWKRLVDILGASLALLFASPVIVLLTVMLAFTPPVFFFQQRAGKRGKPFTLFKFRSMNMNKDAEGKLLPDAERITALGRIVRNYSIDELLQLVNVLKGDMSLVGPRPLLMEYVLLYSPEQSKRLSVKPGITGLAQIQGRNSLSWEERFRLDVEYVDKLSFWLDFKILLLTPLRVLAKRGVNYHTGEMPPFKGSGQDL